VPEGKRRGRGQIGLFRFFRVVFFYVEGRKKEGERKKKRGSGRREGERKRAREEEEF
jgi:hypothetical protein